MNFFYLLLFKSPSLCTRGGGGRLIDVGLEAKGDAAAAALIGIGIVLDDKVRADQLLFIVQRGTVDHLEGGINVKQQTKIYGGVLLGGLVLPSHRGRVRVRGAHDVKQIKVILNVKDVIERGAFGDGLCQRRGSIDQLKFVLKAMTTAKDDTKGKTLAGLVLVQI